MSTKVNHAGVKYARQLIKDGKTKNDSGHWSQHQPDTAAENKFINDHGMAEYAKWHLGEDPSMGQDTKGRYKFPYGDFQTVHRDGLLAAKERAAQQGYHDIEQAADELESLLAAD